MASSVDSIQQNFTASRCALRFTAPCRILYLPREHLIHQFCEPKLDSLAHSQPEDMHTSFTLRRVIRRLLAILFAICATTYSVFWIIQFKHSTPQRGFTNYEYSEATRSMKIDAVVPGSAAERAGLRAGDYIIGVNGRSLDTLRPFYEAIIIGANDPVELTVRDSTSSAKERSIRFSVHNEALVPSRTMHLKDLLGLPIYYYPLGFLIVGIGVLVLRPDDPNAWLLALLFGGYLAIAPLFEGNIPPPIRGFVVFYKIVMSWSGLALFYYFFAAFPSPSPLDRKGPWLKYALLSGALITAVPIGFRCLLAGGTLPLYLGFRWPGAGFFNWVLAFQTGLPAPAPRGWPSPLVVFIGSFIGAVMLGLASLICNSLLSPDAQVRRKARVMLWGTGVGTAPVCLVTGVVFFGGVKSLPLAFWQISVLLLSWLWPLSFAYAVVKHRVLEIPLLLKHSARYIFVQRGYVVFLFAAGAAVIALFTHTISPFFSGGSNVGMAVSATFGIVLIWASAPVVKRGIERIDKAFFRSAYDARVILQDLTEKARGVTDRHELVSLLVTKIEGALHPKSLACYLEGEDGKLVARSGTSEQGSAKSTPVFARLNSPSRFGAFFSPDSLDTIPRDLPLLQELAEHGKAWDVPPAPDSLGGLTDQAPECLVPMLGRSSRLIGLLVLGQRRSEEPYSREDKQLLESVAGQAGITLENIDLAETMARRMEAERRVAMEMDIARRVQARLFPQKLPALATLDCIGGCIQARQVGGDYYDFLDMGSGAMGVVLADISGKGISGALLMANLQANLRSQYALAIDDLPRLLTSVNRLFYENTTDESYATLFFGVYEDTTRRLRFANCGHVSPLVLHPDGTVQRLASTTTVLGLFLDWPCHIQETTLLPGDVLVIYSDGVTEATDENDNEYGEQRLISVIQGNTGLPVGDLLSAVQANVQEFSGPTQADDITLILARCH